jgi:hypothetical protein
MGVGYRRQRDPGVPRFAGSARGQDLQAARVGACLPRQVVAVRVGVSAEALKAVEAQRWVRSETFRAYTDAMRQVLIERRAAFEALVMLAPARARAATEPSDESTQPISAST